MQDKEFDKLFQQRFESFEFEPSEAVWNNINSKLKKDANRRIGFGLYWMAAASVVAVLGAAIWFAPQQEKVWLRKEEPPIAATTKVENSQKVEVALIAPREPEALSQAPKLTGSRSKPGKDVKQPEESYATRHRKQAVAEANVVESADELKASEGIIAPQNAFASSEVVLEESVVEERPVIAAANSEHVDDESPKERNVKSIGDLVNFVVSKVDKRQDKLIQFKDNDEGSFITGVNLGFVKIKSRNQIKD